MTEDSPWIIRAQDSKDDRCLEIDFPLAFLVAQLVKNLPAMQDTRFDSWVRKIHWRRDRLPTPVFLGFPCGSAGKESTCNVGGLGSILGLGRCPGEGTGYPLQYSCLENSMDCIVHGVSKSQTRLSSFHVRFSISCEKPSDFCLMLLVLLTASVAFLFLIFKPLKLWRQSVSAYSVY